MPPLSARPFGGVRLYDYCQYVAYIDKKCYPQNEISIYILMRIKTIAKNENKRRFILIRIKICIIIDIKICIHILIIILIRIIINIKIRLDTIA